MASSNNKSSRTKKPKEPVYPLFKYIELEMKDIHPYTRAYVIEQFHGILKTKEEWAETLKPILEGNK